VRVVNHISDSVSIVSLEEGKERVIKTLLEGDEPRDIVFAGKIGNVPVSLNDQHQSYIVSKTSENNILLHLFTVEIFNWTLSTMAFILIDTF